MEAIKSMARVAAKSVGVMMFFVQTYRQFLAAKSRCTKFFSVMYFIPTATCIAKFISSPTAKSLKIKKQQKSTYMYNHVNVAMFLDKLYMVALTCLASRTKLSKSLFAMNGSTTCGLSLRKQIPNKLNTFT